MPIAPSRMLSVIFSLWLSLISNELNLFSKKCFLIFCFSKKIYQIFCFTKNFFQIFFSLSIYFFILDFFFNLKFFFFFQIFFYIHHHLYFSLHYGPQGINIVSPAISVPCSYLCLAPWETHLNQLCLYSPSPYIYIYIYTYVKKYKSWKIQ